MMTKYEYLTVSQDYLDEQYVFLDAASRNTVLARGDNFNEAERKMLNCAGANGFDLRAVHNGYYYFAKSYQD